VLVGPLNLYRHTARELGLVEMCIGLGMLAGSLTISAWGGPKGRKLWVVFVCIALAALGLVIAGLSPHVVFIGTGVFILLFNVPVASGINQAVFQTKVRPEVQGRIFAVRSMISRSIMPLAFLIAGPLADRVLEPAMAAGSPLAASFVGALLGVGPGRGIGLGFVLSGLALLAACALAYANPRLRLLEDELPDEI
jgi:hypothetical protein